MNPRSYGPIARTALLVGMSEGGATQHSFAAHLTAKLGRPVSRDTVANWMADREHVPGDAVVAMAEHVPNAAREILQVLAGELGFLVVKRPTGLAEGEQPVVLAGGAAGSMGLLVQQVIGEEHPDSDGGRTRTPGELAQRMRRIEEAEGQIARLRALTEAELDMVRPRSVARS